MTTADHCSRLGIDLGDGCTYIAAAEPGPGPCTLELPGLSRPVPVPAGTVPVHAIPSLVTYRDGNAMFTGEAVLRHGFCDHPGTARWIRSYALDGNTAQIPSGRGQTVGYDAALGDFLIPVLAGALEKRPGAVPVFALPRGAPARFTDLLRRAARAAGAPSCAFTGEDQAAAAGYGTTLVPGEPFLFLIFTETGMEARVISATDRPVEPGEDGTRILARASGTVSCRDIDARIRQDLFRKFRLLESDPRAVRLLPRVQAAAEQLREQVPVTGTGELRLKDELSCRTFSSTFTTEDLAGCIDRSGAVPLLLECCRKALTGLRAATGREKPAGVFLLGSGCALPAIRDAVRSYFPAVPVHADHPRDAVARGAALALLPAATRDRIASSYALRYWDPAAREHRYRFLVHSGTCYPSAGQVARVIISAAYDGQTHLGIPLCEISGAGTENGRMLELVRDTGGGVRVALPEQDAGSGGSIVHANERSPTLLVATPPARKGEPRFECTFSIDPDRNLRLSARDLLTGALVKLDAPIHRLN